MLKLTFNEFNEIVGPKPEVRYIKLGQGNAWAERAFRSDEIPFSFREASHELALTLDEVKIAGRFIELGRTQGAATSAARQIIAFYTLDAETVWITFAQGKMWWTQAGTDVTWLGESDDYAPRIRRTRFPWVCVNKFDVPYFISDLSSKLTKVAGTQQTLCKVDAADYVFRKLYGSPEPSLVRAEAAKQAALEAIIELIGNLHWGDFETLIDLLLREADGIAFRP